MTEPGTIAVGIDGGPASIAAMTVALNEARLRNSLLLAVSCWPVHARGHGSVRYKSMTREHASTVLEHTIHEALLGEPEDVSIVREVSLGLPGPALVSVSKDAELLVLGSTTLGPSARHHGHHVLDHCLRYALSPVLVVPWRVDELDDIEADIALHLSSPAY